MKTPINLDEYSSGEDLELQVRQVRKLISKPRISMMIYAWLSEKRKKENVENKGWGWKYCPFSDDDKFTFTYRGLKLKGKINSIDRDYYDGDCLILYTELDKRSSDRWNSKTVAKV